MDPGSEALGAQMPAASRAAPGAEKVFPGRNCRITTHRDPVAVIQSAITMTGYCQRFYRTSVEPEKLLAYWTDRIEHLLRACVRDRAVWPEAQSIDTYFHQFMADDMGTIEIEAKAGLTMTCLHGALGRSTVPEGTIRAARKAG